MADNPMIFAGVDVSAGRKPVIFAALDGELNIASLNQWSLAEAAAGIKGYERIVLALNASAHSAAALTFKNDVSHASWKPVSSQGSSRRILETDPQHCFQALAGQGLLPRRTLEGRIQRALILYEEGFQIPDPMDFFEEITRHKLIQGILPLETLQTSKQLDALVCAYVAWMVVNRPGQVELSPQNFALPKRSEG